MFVGETRQGKNKAYFFVTFTHSFHYQPFALVKIAYHKSKLRASLHLLIARTIAPKFDEAAPFKSCVLINIDRLLVITLQYMTIFDTDLVQLRQVSPDEWNPDAYMFMHCQHDTSSNSPHIYLALRMENVSEFGVSDWFS